MRTPAPQAPPRPSPPGSRRQLSASAWPVRGRAASAPGRTLHNAVRSALRIDVLG